MKNEVTADVDRLLGDRHRVDAVEVPAIHSGWTSDFLERRGVSG